MAWFKVDAHYSGHPAVLKAGDDAMGLWLRMGCWLATFPDQGDLIPRGYAKHVGRPSQIKRLLAAQLLIETDGGYILNRSMAIATSGLPGNSWEVDNTRSRDAIPNALRARVYDRDGRACVECGAREDLSLDHVWPHALGGEDTFDNLRTLCRPCNSRKGARV